MTDACASRSPTARLATLLAVATGLVAANIYYAQPLAGPIAEAIGMSPGTAGLIVTLTQAGYGVGLLLIVPLGDLVENRALTLALIAVATLGLIGAATVAHSLPFLMAASLIGLGSVAVQVLVPYAAHLADDASRGRVVGNVMGGLMLGIMLARPVAGIIAEYLSWRAVFTLSAGAMLVLSITLAMTLPRRAPASGLDYRGLLASMARLAVNQPILRRRAFYHACMFGAFSLFWTTAPLLLAGHAFGLSQSGIALFSLAGVAGAIATPIAGRMADAGLARPATFLAMQAVMLAFLMTWIAPMGTHLSLAVLVAAAILLDFGVAANLILGQQAIYALDPESRSRLNGMYMATFFAGGAVGSAVGGWAFAHGGWPLASLIGFAMPVPALLVHWRNESDRRHSDQLPPQE